MKHVLALPLAVLPLALAAAACTQTGEQPPERYATASNAKALATAAPIGEPESCLHITRIKSTEGVSDRAIIFEMTNGDLYRNELPTRCPEARRNTPYRYSTSIPQLCRGEILTYFDPTIGIDYGSCGLGEFVPISEDAGDMETAAAES